MPRSVSGNYTLPLPPVVPNTTIEADWANTTDDDMAQALTDSLDRYGRGGMVAPFRLVDGSESIPAWAFAAETGTGMWRDGAGVLALSVQGARVAQWSASGYSVNGALLTNQGIDATPAQVEIGGARTADGTAYIDFIAAAGSPDFNFRVLRDAGTNGAAGIINSGTGLLNFHTDNQPRLVITGDGRLYGTALHNNAGPVTGATNQYIASGTYTPAFALDFNVDSATFDVASWVRVGNVVTVGGTVTLDTTAAGSAGLFIGLPIASSGFVGGGNIAAGSVGGMHGYLLPVGTAMQCIFQGNGGSLKYGFSFSYSVV